jgi:hypothetical protein
MMSRGRHCVVLEALALANGNDAMTDRKYEVRVTGLVPTQDLLDELGDVEVTEHEVRTVISGCFPDQAALYGFLHRLRAFGLEVVEVRRVAGVEEPAGGEDER